jgi:hypothetical protein
MEPPHSGKKVDPISGTVGMMGGIAKFRTSHDPTGQAWLTLPQFCRVSAVDSSCPKNQPVVISSRVDIQADKVYICIYNSCDERSPDQQQKTQDQQQKTQDQQ